MANKNLKSEGSSFINNDNVIADKNDTTGNSVLYKIKHIMNNNKNSSFKQISLILLGPLVFTLLLLMGKPETMSQEAHYVLAITIWIALWWITEAVPIAIAALLPIVLFPITGVLSLSATTSSFGHKYLFLYMGGFMLAIAIQKWGLHKRIALNIINIIGSSVTNIILGFMVSTAFLSMWISNTATSVMMLPIGMAVVSQFNKNTEGNGSNNFGKALMLGIAYSSSIGGIATLIGTPPNLVLAGILEEIYNEKISFLQWMKFGLPISITLLFVAWKYLTKYAFKFEQKTFLGGKKEIKNELNELGRITYEEKVVMVVFVATAFAWIFRASIQQFIPNIDDTIIAITAGIILFMIPAKKAKGALLSWDEAVKLPWDIILLFGGGLALAKGFSDTGLARWIADQLLGMNGFSLLLLILILVTVVNFLTEFTSNLATTAMLLPVLAPIALSFNLHPYMIMVPVTLAASCAFMLPVATPPNAVVFGSGYLRIPDMMRAGFMMNLISILLITAFAYFLLPYLWDINANEFPIAFRDYLMSQTIIK